MLRNRVITALILAPLVIAGVFWLPNLYFAVIFWALTALAMYEWAGLLKLQQPLLKLAYVLGYAAFAIVLFLTTPFHHAVLLGTVMLWIAAIVAVLAFPRGQALYANPVLLAPLGWLLIGGAWLAIVKIHALPQGSLWIVWMLLLVWAADIGAYFAGKRFGRRRLAPAVSPGKTWEGVAGGFGLATTVCGGLVLWWQPQAVMWLLITFGLIAISVFGDLFESVLKRATGIKDSGTLLPGHGGMLDRIDSALAVLPALAVILLTMEV